MSKANDTQFGGEHYRKTESGEVRPLQHWDIVTLFDLDYFTGTSSKYMFRWKQKGGILDLEKSGHYIVKKVEIEKAREAGTLTRGILEAALAYLDKVDAAKSSEELRATMASDAEWDRRSADSPMRVTGFVRDDSSPTGTRAVEILVADLAHVDLIYAAMAASVSSGEHCALCGQVGSHAADCTRRQRKPAHYCSLCDTVDGHLSNCPNCTTATLVGGADRAPTEPTERMRHGA